MKFSLYQWHIMNWTYPVQADGKLMSNVYIFLGWSWSLSSIRRNFTGMSCYFFSFVDSISRQQNHAQISTKFKQVLLQLTLFICLLNLQTTLQWLWIWALFLSCVLQTDFKELLHCTCMSPVWRKCLWNPQARENQGQNHWSSRKFCFE